MWPFNRCRKLREQVAELTARLSYLQGEHDTYAKLVDILSHHETEEAQNARMGLMLTGNNWQGVVCIGHDPKLGEKGSWVMHTTMDEHATQMALEQTRNSLVVRLYATMPVVGIA